MELLLRVSREFSTETYTSRTTSGSMRVRSSPLRSLQQTPSGRAWREQLAASGIGWELGAAASKAHTGGFVEFSEASGRRRGTEGAGAESEEEDMVAGRKSFLLATAVFGIILEFQAPWQPMGERQLACSM